MALPLHPSTHPSTLLPTACPQPSPPTPAPHACPTTHHAWRPPLPLAFVSNPTCLCPAFPRPSLVYARPPQIRFRGRSPHCPAAARASILTARAANSLRAVLCLHCLPTLQAKGIAQYARKTVDNAASGQGLNSTAPEAAKRTSLFHADAASIPSELAAWAVLPAGTRTECESVHSLIPSWLLLVLTAHLRARCAAP